MDLAAALQEPEDRQRVRAFAKGIINVDRAFERAVPRETLRDELAQPVVEQPGRIAIDSGQLGSGTRRSSGHKMFQQSFALLIRQF
jgi:hypothetical protein